MAMLYRSIYKCPLCKTVFHDKEQANIPKHIHEHVKNCTAVCYHCLICPEVFESKAELAEHLSTGKPSSNVLVPVIFVVPILLRPGQN